jgi:hypothetical protein
MVLVEPQQSQGSSILSLKHRLLIFVFFNFHPSFFFSFLSSSFSAFVIFWHHAVA